MRMLLLTGVILMAAVSGCSTQDTTPVMSAAVLSEQPAATTPSPTDGTILLTVFLKHDQSKTLDEISAHLEKTGFWKEFPPAGVEVESWKIVMGIGQVATLRVPAAKLRDVNRTLERTAWGAYRTEFYPTYDYMPIAAERKKAATGQ